MFVDLSHPIESGISIFPGYPQPKIKKYLSYEETRAGGKFQGCCCQIDNVSFVSSTATYMDAPAHYYEGKDGIYDLTLSRLILDAVLFDCESIAVSDAPIRLEDKIEEIVARYGELEGKAIIVKTGWYKFWKQDAYYIHPFVDKRAVDALLELKPALVAIDTLLIDSIKDKKRPAHCGFLDNGVLIVENLANLGELPEIFKGYFIPLALVGAVSTPIRAFASLMVEE